MRSLIDVLPAGELNTFREHVSDFLSWVEDDKIQYGKLADEAMNLKLTLQRELRFIMMVGIGADSAKMYNLGEKYFGAGVSDAFPNAIYEIDEAVKCFSLERYTASVCHLMRTCEVALYAFLDNVDAARPQKPAEKNWSLILKRIAEQINSKWPNAKSRMNDDYKSAAELHAALVAIKDAYRNESMHVSGKYTEEEAEHIMATVKGFMQKAANRLS